MNAAIGLERGRRHRLIALVDKIGVDAAWFTLLQALEPASAH